MAPLNCCSFRRNVSPAPEPVRIVDTSQPKARFALSSHSLTPTESPETSAPIRDIFASTSEDTGPHQSSAMSEHDLLSLHEMEAGIHRRHSSRKLRDVASKVRKRMSRDSGMSKQSSKRVPRVSQSGEDLNRREELKRALHRRVRDDVLDDSMDDSTADDDHYDDDAVPIKTPRGTWGRHEGSIHVSPRYLSNVLRRSDSPSNAPQTEIRQSELPGTYAPANAAVTLSRMLTQRASHMTGESEEHFVNAVVESPVNVNKKRYVFEEDTPKATSPTRTSSPLGRSSTVIRAASATKPMESQLANPTFLHTLGVPPSPKLIPSRLSSISNLMAADEWHLSSSEVGKGPGRGPLPATLGLSSRPFDATFSGIYDTRIRPASEFWLHGASGMLSRSTHVPAKLGDHTRDDKTDHGHPCDPGSEEMGFGGIDGEDGSPPVSIYHTARTRNHSEGTQSVHMYNMHIPSRLASKSLLTSISFPQLLESRRKRSFSSQGSDMFSVKPQRQASSSGIMTNSRTSSSGHASPRVPMAWDNLDWRPASSIYSSQPDSSLMSSKQNSLRRITSLSNRLQQLKAYTPSGEIISVAATSRKSVVDLDKLERRTTDTSFHSSNESLGNRELAAAEARIASLPRSNTLPKSSRFREDFDHISAEIALTNPPRRRASNARGERTNPPRRRASNLDGSGDWNRASQAAGIEEATSIWERALREHSREDAVISHTRLGSRSPDSVRGHATEDVAILNSRLEAGSRDISIGPTKRDGVGRVSSARTPSSRPLLARAHKHLSLENWHGSHLQASLAAYKLPTSPSKEQPVENVQRSTSVHSTSSWARFPSHTRSERSLSPAGEYDQVIARDFASMTADTPQESSPTRIAKGKERTSFSKQVLSSIKHIYRTQSQELLRRLQNEARGHRSSISQGGVLEYPELEMLSGSISPPMPSPDVAAKIEMDELFRKESQPDTPGNKSVAMPAKQHSSEEEARVWSKFYTDCVVYPRDTEASNSAVVLERRSEDIGPKDVPREVRSDVQNRRVEVEGDRKVSRSITPSRERVTSDSSSSRMVEGVSSGSGDSELRASTLDFKRSLELHELRAKESVFGGV